MANLNEVFNKAIQHRKVWKQLKLSGESVDISSLFNYLDTFKEHVQIIFVQGLQSLVHDLDLCVKCELVHVVITCFKVNTLIIEDSPMLNETFLIFKELRDQIHTLRLRNLTNIVPSTLAYRNDFNNKKFASVMEQFTELRELEITDTSSIRTATMYRFLRKMPKLVHLNIQGTGYKTPKSVVNVMASCPTIETLLFSHQQFTNVQSRNKSLREWYHLTRMCYPWVKFSKGLTSDVEEYLTTKKIRVSSA